MKNKKNTPTIVITGFLTVITIAFWIGFEVYRIFTIKPEPSVPTPIIAPISPVLDPATLDKLPNTLYLDETQIGQIVIQESEPEVQPTPVSTESGILNP